MKRRYLLVLVVAAFLLQQYNKRPSPPEPVQIEEGPLQATPLLLDTAKIPVTRLVKTDSTTAQTILINEEEHLFGSFYGGRAEFFIVDTPEQQLHNAKVESITYCYLDGRLCRSKYALDSDITTALIQKYGKFKIRPYDHNDKSVIENQKELVDYGNGMELNRNLKNYELSWRVEGMQIMLRVNRYGADPSFYYTEQTRDYTWNFRDIEYNSL